jgi:uncharacterized membrane protein YbaN (DUF454 family)
MKNILLIVLGGAALALGMVGVFLPILPTTPFVMIAAGCFSASSPKLYKKLANTKYFGEYVRSYREKTGISKRARIVGITFLWATLIISSVLVRRPTVWLILGIVGIAVTVHILTIRRSGNPQTTN